MAGEEERRRCCLLGGCGCGPGSAAQRAEMEMWLRDHFQHSVPTEPAAFEEHMKKVLDALPWELAKGNPAG